MSIREVAINVLGYAGAVFLTLLTVPQVYHSYKTKSVQGLSNSFLFFELMASLCFVSYGILLPSLHVIIANSAALLGTLLLIVAKFIFKEKKQTKETELEIQM